MADKDRGQNPQLKDILLKEGHRHSFIQAYRLILYLLDKEHGPNSDFEELSRYIRVRPELTLAFPKTDVADIEVLSGDKDLYRITTTFLGLYGPSSPLPTFYTEDLLQEQAQDHTISRDFIDIFSARIYKMFFECWGFSKLYYQLFERKDEKMLFRLFSLIGFEGEKVRERIDDAESLLRYTGIFSQFPRSAEGLRSLVAGNINVRKVQVIQCEERVVPIPRGQRFSLGSSCSILGEDTHIGDRIPDRSGKFSVKIGPVDHDTYETLLPDAKKFRTMNQAISLYLDQPLLWDIELLINGKDTSIACLGGNKWSRLGYNTWAGDPLPETYKVRFSCN
jgi:type VI secretion system protein ImpH